MLIAGIGVSVIVSIANLYMTDLLPVDISSALFCVMGMVMYYNTFHYLPMVTLNITRKMILSYLSEPVVLFDYEGHLADYSIDILKVLM